jgi:hypothetical protein
MTLNNGAVTLRTCIYPLFGHFPVQDVDVTLALKSLGPIRNSKTETAMRLRGRIENVLDSTSA